MNPVWGQLAGGLIWLVFELVGVFGKYRGRDTTSEWVWWVESRWPVARFFVGMFVVSLLCHFRYHTPLVP